MTIIDPPSDFATLAEWKMFLATMERAKPRDADIEAGITLARERIATLETSDR